MRRVVLDTNVWVSLFVTRGGLCQRLVDRLVDARVQLATSQSLLEELARVLRDKFDYRPQELQEAMIFVQTLCMLVEPSEHLSGIVADTADHRVLECAVEARADCIVTGDAKHLLPLRTFRGIPIRSPRDVLERLG